MMLGAGAVLAYQSMSNRTKRKVESAVRSAAQLAENKLDDMM